MRIELSAADARRLVLGAQGFTAGRPPKAGLAHLRQLAARLMAFQIDSVNVLVRAHYMPGFSRLGPYRTQLLDDMAYKRRELFEYWGHAACLLPVSLHTDLRWRMDAQRNADYWRKAPAAARRYVESVYADIAERGPLSAGEVAGAGKARGNWWGWSDGKRAVEMLWRMGRLAVSGRRNFERLYDLTERVLPKAVLDAPTPSPDDAKKRLLVYAASALGVGTARDIAAYFHVEGWWDRNAIDGKRPRSQVPRLVNELVDDGRLVPATVEGWRAPAFMVPGARPVDTDDVRAIVSPFDPLIWDRARTAEGARPPRVFGFDYQIEIYVPEHKRVHGYYVLPFLLDDRFAARVDLKADRKRGALLVRSAWIEDHAPPRLVAAQLAAELRLVADWLALEEVVVAERGDLARPLKRALPH